MLKKSLVILLTLLITLSFCSVAHAAQNTAINNDEKGEDQVLWTYIWVVTNWMDINAYGQASMASTIRAYDGVERVMMNNSLQKLAEDGTWTTVKRWSNTYYDNEGSWMQTWYVMSGYNYRLRTYFYAFDGLESESTTLNSGTVYY